MFEIFLFRVVSPRKNLFGFLAFLILSLLVFSFLDLSLLALNRSLLLENVEITSKIQSITLPYLTGLMVFVSFFGEVTIAGFSVFLLAVWLLWKGYTREILYIPAVLAAPAFTFLSKNIFAIPRPTEYLVNIYQPVSGYSFPSGHVLFYTVFFGFIAFLGISLPSLQKLWRFILLSISIPMILFIGFSRIYLGAHWPSDVFGAYFIGFALLEFLLLVYLKLTYLPQMRNKQNKTNYNGKN